MSDVYANWNPQVIDSLLAEHEVEWHESLPWPILELIRRYASGRLVDRDAINVEAVAAVEHDQWIHWTAYMLDNNTAENAERWRRQITTPYAELTETEKDTDREWAHKSLAAGIGDTDA